MFKKWFLICTFVFGFSLQANADTITKEAVDNHLKAMVDLYNVNPVDLNAIYQFVKAYTVDGGLYISKIYVNDKEPIEKSQDRVQVLRDIRESAIEYKEAMARYEIKSFDPAQDGETALVKYTVWHDAAIERNVVNQGVMKIPFTSVSECEETFAVKDGGVKGLNNKCEIRIQYQEPNLSAP